MQRFVPSSRIYSVCLIFLQGRGELWYPPIWNPLEDLQTVVMTIADRVCSGGCLGGGEAAVYRGGGGGSAAGQRGPGEDTLHLPLPHRRVLLGGQGPDTHFPPNSGPRSIRVRFISRNPDRCQRGI